MEKNNYLLFGILLLGGMMLITPYSAPAINQINFSLCTGYTAPAINQINFTLGDSDACAALDTCTYSSGNWTINCADTCNITTNQNIGSGWFIGYGTGNINLQANITKTGGLVKHDGCNITIFNGLGGFR